MKRKSHNGQFSTVYDLAYNSVSSLQTEVNEGLTIFSTREHFNPSPCDEVLKFLSPALFHKYITIKVNKAVGTRFSGKCWKKHSSRLVFSCTIFSGCITTAYFPLAWKITKVIPILKPGKNHKLSENYIPISLLPITAKTIFMEHKNKNNIIINE